MDLQVLYEDNHLIAVYKPAGVLVQEDKTGDPSLLDQVKYYLKNKYHKPGQVFLGLIHRLDRPVSGIIILGKTSKGAARLSEQFRSHEVEKIYHALVLGKPGAVKGHLTHYIKKNENTNKVTISREPFEDAQEARLHYEIVKTNGKYSILKIILGTGRSHQIRSQLSDLGHPIVGDVKYGAPEPLPDKSLALCATSLTFKTATGDEVKNVQIEIPKEWNKYL
jgi:23S rRNA pseudouridine1911/1915/1917 synthase